MGEALGVAVSYADLRRLVALRRRELRLSQLAVDDLAGLQSGYTSKLECGDRCFGDMSLGAVLGALGLKIVLMRAQAAHEVERLGEYGLSGGMAKKHHATNGTKGAKKTNGEKTAEERSAAARKASRVRWKGHRARREALALVVAEIERRRLAKEAKEAKAALSAP